MEAPLLLGIKMLMGGEAIAWKDSKDRNIEDFLLFFVPKIYSAHYA